jgi:copper chaperone
METLSFDIRGMTCGGCRVKVEHRLAQLNGVSKVAVTLHPGLAIVLADPAQASAAQIVSVINAAGFSATPKVAARQGPPS